MPADPESLRNPLTPYRTHKGPLVADDATIALVQFISCDALGVRRHPDPIVLVGSKTWEAEQSQRNIVGTLARQKISMMHPAHAIDDRDPEPCILLERGKLVRVNDVSEVTGNQSRNSFDNVFALGMRLPAFGPVVCEEQVRNRVADCRSSTVLTRHAEGLAQDCGAVG